MIEKNNFELLIEDVSWNENLTIESKNRGKDDSSLSLDEVEKQFMDKIGRVEKQLMDKIGKVEKQFMDKIGS